MNAWVKSEPVALPLEFTDRQESVKITGFWMFLVSDLLVFASLFSVYAVYRSQVINHLGPARLFHLGPALLETLLLLTSSFTISLAIFAMRQRQVRAMVIWLVVTIGLGAGFVTTELHEFISYGAAGATWHQSGFLSGFFILVGTHGAHVTFGILLALSLLWQLSRHGLTAVTARKLYTFSLYWHFLDIVWVFIFTFVYLNGKLP